MRKGQKHSAETRAKMSEAHNRPEVKAKMRATMNRPEVKARRREAAKIAQNRPEVKAKHREALNHPEVKARRRETMNRPEVKAKKSEALKRVLNQPEVKAKQRAALKIALNRPEVRAKHRETMNRPEVKAKHREATKIAMNRPEVKMKMRERASYNTRELLKKNGHTHAYFYVIELTCGYLKVGVATNRKRRFSAIPTFKRPIYMQYGTVDEVCDAEIYEKRANKKYRVGKHNDLFTGFDGGGEVYSKLIDYKP